MAAPFFKDSHELRCNALKLRLQEVITQDHVVQEEEKKKKKEESDTNNCLACKKKYRLLPEWQLAPWD